MPPTVGPAILAGAAAPPGTAQPRIVVRRPRPGFFHPLTRGEIRAALAFFGPLVTYGIRSIELRQCEPGEARPTLARLEIPGRIVLFEQAIPPWIVKGRPRASTRRRLKSAGASLTIGLDAFEVDWPPGSLAAFLLFDGLFHEIGHHLVQQHTGKREARVRRSTDHERAAARFAAACRVAWAERSDPS